MMQFDEDDRALLEKAAAEKAPLSVFAAERDGLEDVVARVEGCDFEGRREPTLECRLGDDGERSSFEVGDFLEARIEVAGQTYCFDAFVFENVRRRRGRAVFLSVCGAPALVGRRQRVRVEPAGTLHLRVALGGDDGSLKAVASDHCGVVGEGLLRNISAGGVGVVFHSSLAKCLVIDAAVAVAVHLPGDASEMLVRGKVVHLKAKPRRQTLQCGIAFDIDKPPSPEVRRIAAYVMRERKTRALASSGLRFW